MDESIMVLLVGEQPAPNLLPLRHYQSEGAVLIFSKLTERIADNLDPVLKLKKKTKCRVDAYSVDNVRKALHNMIQHHQRKGKDLVFNLTGGTKLMMLGAYIVAQELGSRWFYLESETASNKAHCYSFENGVRAAPEHPAGYGGLNR